MRSMLRPYVGSKLALTALLLAGCATEAAPCAELAEKLADCGGQEPGFIQACEADDQLRMELDMHTCDTIDATGGRADGIVGWRDMDEDCVWNWQCRGNLVCREYSFPASARCENPASMLSPYFERLCDDDDDCGDGQCAGAPFFSCEPARRGAACEVDDDCESTILRCSEGTCHRTCRDAYPSYASYSLQECGGEEQCSAEHLCQ